MRKISFLIVFLFTALLGIAQPGSIIQQPISASALEAINHKLISDFTHADFLGGRYQIIQDLRSGEFSRATNIGGNLKELGDITAYSNLKSTASTDNGLELWRQAYKPIVYANITIDRLPVYYIITNEVLRTLGRGRLIRAAGYYHLMQIYGPHYSKGNIKAIPMPLKQPTMDDLSRGYPKDSTINIYNQIIIDLNYAETTLTETPDSYSFHKNIAIAYKLKAYLAMQDYPNAIAEGNKLVSLSAPFSSPSGVPHSLEPNFTSLFTGSYSGNEFIFTAKPQLGFNISRILYHHYEANKSIYFLKPDGFISDPDFRSSDARRSLFESNPGGLALSKFTDPTAFVPVIRFAEVLLNLAEALTMNSSSVDARAVALLTAVRQRSDPGYTFSLATKQDVLDAILQERKYELMGEGHITPFLLRHQLPLLARPGFSQVLPADPTYIWEIPLNERMLNRALY